METHHEQRMTITFCFKNELTATEAFKMLQKVYGNECLSRMNAMAERAWMMIREWGTSEPVEHRNTSQKYALLWQMTNIQQSER